MVWTTICCSFDLESYILNKKNLCKFPLKHAVHSSVNYSISETQNSFNSPFFMSEPVLGHDPLPGNDDDSAPHRREQQHEPRAAKPAPTRRRTILGAHGPPPPPVPLLTNAGAGGGSSSSAAPTVKLRGALEGTMEPDLGSLGRLRVNCIDRGKAPLMAYIYSMRTNRRAAQGLLYKKE
jgi:hypothetical protein